MKVLGLTEYLPIEAGMVWEFMFTRSMYQTEDMAEQSNLLNKLSQAIEDGVIITTCNDVVKPINAKNLRDVHQHISINGSSRDF